jgi:hypothetical protein
MNKQDNREADNQQSPIEDLTVNEDKAEEVKAGRGVDYFLRLQGIDGEAT